MENRILGLLVLLLFFAAGMNGSEVSKTDLFESGKDGYALYRIPGIVATKKGTVLAYCEARKNEGGDWGPIDVLMRRSLDGGESWLPRQKIVHVEGELPINPVAAAQNLDRPGENTVNNPVAIVDHESGAIHFLYCLEYMRCFYLRSDDEGATWTEPVEITRTFEAFRPEYDWKVIATGPAHGIQLTRGPRRGRLVVPVWLSLGTGGHAHRPSVTSTVYSDDHGKTWHRGEIAVPDTETVVYPNETVIVELSDGRVMLNSRSESRAHRRVVTVSPDGATGWSEPRFDPQLLEPICMAGMARVRWPEGGKPGLIAFSNPHNLGRADGKEAPGKGRDRRNVSVKLSDDEGETWTVNRTLEEGFSGYSDLAALEDGTMLCFYERGSTDGKSNYRTGRLTVAKFDEAWVRGGDDADLCVYGGTSGGVVAAVQAARMGKRVVLVEPGGHLGGMTSGGLSAVDIGDPRSVGGIAREYFTRLVARYGKTLNWDQPFRSSRGGPATGGAYSIEPHVAEEVFDGMAKEAGVRVMREARLQSVIKDGGRIAELTLEDGRSVRAKMFLDTTYEGDLMAAAGVSHTLTREGNAKYGEQYNGIHYAEKYRPRSNHLAPGDNGRVPGGQGVWDRDFPLDPRVKKGDSTSGLLPLINEGDPGRPGDPAPGVMAYCFRLCLSTAEDRLPIEPPPDYDPDRYELVGRFVEACLANGDDMDLRWFSKHDPLPNEKWDFNTATFGGNLPGLSWDWPEASYDEREKLAAELENYHRGLFHFLRTDPRVPEKVKKDLARFGLPADEFEDNGGWPHQVYVREGRRMVSDLVLTEHHTFGRETAPHSIGLGSYGTDVHEIRRIVKDGVVTREGKVAGGRGGFGPYQIGYGAIVPKAGECGNLLVTFALSASHTAFASIRMEPVFMVTSQSAATAACLAIDEGVTVREVDYGKLRDRLEADGQVLRWPPSSAGELSGIVLDDRDAKTTGEWTVSSAQPSPVGVAYRHDNNQGRGEKTATFTVPVSTGGDYEIRLLYTWHENRSSRTRVSVNAGNAGKVLLVDQREPALVDRVPKALGVFSLSAGETVSVVVSNEGADGYVVVDGLQVLPASVAREERAGKRDSGYPEIAQAGVSSGAVPSKKGTEPGKSNREENSPPDPVSNPESPLMLAGDWVPGDPGKIDFAKLPRVKADHVLLSDVRDRGGKRIHQHAYLAHFGGRFWAMWSDGPGAPQAGVAPERHRNVVPGHDLAGNRVSYATSEDGVTWTEPRDLAGPPRKEGFGWISRGLWVRDGELLALASHFHAPGYAGKGLSLEAFRWDEGEGKWTAHGTVLDDSLNNFPPKTLPSGEWMMTRRDHRRQVSVMIGGVEGFDRWKVAPLASYDGKGRPEEPYWYLLPDGKSIVGLIRDNGRSGRLLRTFSTDNGRTWSPITRTNFPDATSKFYVHRTSRGFYVLVNNPDPKRRDPLTLSISDDGLVYDRMIYLIGGRHIDYPHIIEHGGKLLIAFSGAKQTMEVMRVELDALEKVKMD